MLAPRGVIHIERPSGQQVWQRGKLSREVGQALGFDGLSQLISDEGAFGLPSGLGRESPFDHLVSRFDHMERLTNEVYRSFFAFDLLYQRNTDHLLRDCQIHQNGLVRH